jgi:broad specificity phosphatase PhoE
MNQTLPHFEYFYFIRHGRTEANEKQLMSGGKNDILLNEVGHQQALRAAQILKNKCPEIQTLCVSTMVRAKQTAHHINEHLKKPIVEMPELIEWCFGDWEGRTWNEIAPSFLSDEEAPNGETREVFQARVFAGLSRALRHPGPVLVVAHGGVWYKIQKIFNLPPLKTDNCQIFKIYSQKNKDIVEYNYHEIYL